MNAAETLAALGIVGLIAVLAGVLLYLASRDPEPEDQDDWDKRPWGDQ